MVKLSRILRDYQDAGSVNGLLALWGFVDETTFLTKAGHVGVVYRLQGIDYEGLTAAEQEREAGVLAVSTLHFHTDRSEPKPILAKSWKPAEGKDRCPQRPHTFCFGITVLSESAGSIRNGLRADSLS